MNNNFLRKLLRILGFIVGILAAVLYFVIKYQSPHWVEVLFNQGQFQFLNLITAVKTDQSLDFYLGRSAETLWGPLTQLLSGLLFMFLALRFLKTAKTPAFWLAVLSYLLITKFEVLFFPIYGDAIGGPSVEAWWLAHNHFDYARLLHQTGYFNGGPRAYMFSIYPTYLALGMRWLPSPQAVFCVYHFLVFAAMALITAQLRNITARIFSREVAILIALVMLFMPITQSQTEAINMEVPCLFFAMLSASAMVDRRIYRAGLFAVLSAFVKGTGIFACAAVLFCSAVEFFMVKGPKQKFLRVLLALGVACVPVLLVLSKYLLKDQHVAFGAIGWLAGWQSLKLMPTFFIFMFCLAFFAVYWLGRAAAARFRFDAGRREDFYVAFIMFLFGGLWFLLFLNFSAICWRYRVIIQPFMVFGLFYAVSRVVHWEWLRRLGLIVAAGVALFASYGFFYGPMTQNDHVALERSLEYRMDMKLDQKMAKIMEDKYSHYLIGAPFTIAQMLALPQMGYVHKKLDVMIYGYPCTYGGIKNYPGMSNVPISRTVYVGVTDLVEYQLNGQLPYPIGPEDKVIETIHYGNKKISVFVGGVSIEKFWRAQILLQHPDLMKKMGIGGV